MMCHTTQRSAKENDVSRAALELFFRFTSPSRYLLSQRGEKEEARVGHKFFQLTGALQEGQTRKKTTKTKSAMYRWNFLISSSFDADRFSRFIPELTILFSHAKW